ncbi:MULTISPECIES: DUF2237 domain-containing protein [unclassified Devosia]|uniref:DUF2237 family protein n=1 Tax=unclassified Devosia TaxID=196773 RepID=UPI0015532F52
MNARNFGEGAGERNVLGEPLEPCSTSPLTGFFRSGYCAAGPDGVARHLVCIEASEAFLAYSKRAGNDLSTPRPEWGFPGLKAGDRWCLLAERWAQALEAGQAPRVFMHSTNEAVLDGLSLADLKAHARDLN